MRALILFPAICLSLSAAKAPAPGIEIPEQDRAFLHSQAEKLRAEMESMNGPQFRRFLPDVRIFYNAIRYGLDHDMFYKSGDVALAKDLLKRGFVRVGNLKEGKHPWTTATGLVVRGYVSKIDGSVQPYGLVVPEGFSPRVHKRWRLDIWLHGRNNQLSEIRFLADRLKNRGQFTPKDTIILHPYGRFCNAFKFAGEVDVLEALAHVKQQYSIDNERVAMRGFSMGGAGAWHLGAHHAGEWAAVAPGAGFVDTAIYQNIFKKEPKPTWWEQKLWRWYDVPPVAGNFLNTTTIAYSGELDKQKQAADLMAAAFQHEGMTLPHLIGPKTGHKYEPKLKLELSRRVDTAVNRGRKANARKVRLVTHTLRHNRMKWVSVHGLGQHWKPARVEAENIAGFKFAVKTSNVTALMLSKLKVPKQSTTEYTVMIDGQVLKTKTDRFKPILLRKFGGKWDVVPSLAMNSLVKLPGLQGPIDDAFLDRFLFVTPTGKPMNATLGQWVEREMNEANLQWRRQFRGKAPVMKDVHLTRNDLRQNLILWGDPSSNSFIKKIAGHLPIVWTKKGIQLKNETWPADKFVPVLIYPNPFDLRHYVVLNSGFTFSEFGHMSNSMQNAKLPDYAVLDMRVPMAQRIPQGVAHAGFFGERWELTEKEGRD